MSKSIWTVKQEDIDALLDASETQEHIFWGKELVISYKLPSGFTILGRGACVDPANFDIEVGRKVARDMAANKLWELEGYKLQLLMAGDVEYPVHPDDLNTGFIRT